MASDKSSDIFDLLCSGDDGPEIDFARMLRDNADIVIRDIGRVAAGRPDSRETWLEDVEFPGLIDFRISTSQPTPPDPEAVGGNPKRHRSTGNRGNGSPSIAVDLSKSVGGVTERRGATVPPRRSSQVVI